jgi:hypothetical protein
MVETDDDMLWNGTEEDGNIRSRCEEYEGTDCEDSVADCLCALGRKEPSLLIEWKAGLVPELVHTVCRRKKILSWPDRHTCIIMTVMTSSFFMAFLSWFPF